MIIRYTIVLFCDHEKCSETHLRQGTIECCAGVYEFT